MNEKEKKDFYAAMCKCCLIAQAMKECTLCNFNIGLVEQINPVDSVPSAMAVQNAVFAMSA